MLMLSDRVIKIPWFWLTGMGSVILFVIFFPVFVIIYLVLAGIDLIRSKFTDIDVNLVDKIRLPMRVYRRILTSLFTYLLKAKFGILCTYVCLVIVNRREGLETH